MQVFRRLDDQEGIAMVGTAKLARKRSDNFNVDKSLIHEKLESFFSPPNHSSHVTHTGETSGNLRISATRHVIRTTEAADPWSPPRPSIHASFAAYHPSPLNPETDPVIEPTPHHSSEQPNQPDDGPRFGITTACSGWHIPPPLLQAESDHQDPGVLP